MSKKILIADDDKAFVELLSEELRGWGYQTDSVSEGIRVLEVAKKTFPDLILLDLQMPVGKGMEILKRLKKDAQTACTPVVVITGSDPEQERDAVANGASAFFVKPYDRNKLRECLSQILA